jgi:hypothetical protein
MAADDLDRFLCNNSFRLLPVDLIVSVELMLQHHHLAGHPAG